MKIRQGFVSNSSSSSFVVLLPEKFDIENHVKENFDKMSKCTIGDIIEQFSEDFEEMVEMDEQLFAMKKTMDVVELFKKEKHFYSYEKYREIEIIDEILTDYIIAKFDTGSDDGGCELLSRDKIKKIKEILKED